MGSVISDIECPHCGQEAYNDFYYKTGEEYVICNHCGYHYSHTIKNRDKKLNELTEDDWETIEIKEPYGAFRLKTYNSLGYQCGSLIDEEELDNIKMQVNELDALGSVEYFAISQFINKEIVETILIDYGPQTDSAGYTEQDR